MSISTSGSGGGVQEVLARIASLATDVEDFAFNRATVVRTSVCHAITDLFSRRFREGISFPKCLERSILKLPLSKLCAVSLALQNRAFFEGEKGEKGAEKRGGRGVTSKGGKKEKRTHENTSD